MMRHQARGRSLMQHAAVRALSSRRSGFGKVIAEVVVKGNTRITEIAHAAPTKLFEVDSPAQHRSGSACCTIGGYGGGLLGGDNIQLQVDVRKGGTLSLNTLGSTKVRLIGKIVFRIATARCDLSYDGCS